MNDSTDFKTFECPSCGGRIELDTASLPNGKSQTIDCPHCAKPFEIQPASTLPTLPPLPKILPISTDQRSEKKNSSEMLTIGAVGFFLLGGFLFLDGGVNSADESLKEDGSAIRQTVYVLEIGFGGCIMVLSLILRALARLISK